MKRFAVPLTLALVVLLTVALTVAMAIQPDKKDKPEGPKGDKVTITGQLTCVFCTLAHPDKPCPKDCCAGCIKAGDPPLLTDEKGEMYILVNGEIKKALMTPERLEMAGGKVTVKGLVVKGKGVQAIFVDTMEKAGGEKPKMTPTEPPKKEEPKKEPPKKEEPKKP
jgi:hypothetical protein